VDEAEDRGVRADAEGVERNDEGVEAAVRAESDERSGGHP